MKSRHDAWAFLRPLLLALAAAASWIVLSAAGASADSSASSYPLHGAGPATLIPATATVAPTPATTPPLRAAVEEVSGLVDQVVETVPAVDRMVPDGTAAAVVDPATGTVDGLVGAVGTLVPLAGAALEPLDPVLEPVISGLPLPVAAPEGAPDGTPPAVTEVPQVSGETAAHPAETAAKPEGAVPVSAPATSFDTLHRNGAGCDAQMMPASAPAVLPAAGPGKAPVDAPQEPASPAVTAGGSSPSGGHGSAMPGWLGAYHFQIPPAGWAAAQARLLAVPAPVSFDPGSSPD